MVLIYATSSGPERAQGGEIQHQRRRNSTAIGALRSVSLASAKTVHTWNLTKVPPISIDCRYDVSMDAAAITNLLKPWR